jgi:hypothetical protein
VVVKAKKRGTASILHIEGVSALAGLLPPDKRSAPIFDCSYGNVYHHMLRLGYAEHPTGHRNRIVTHQPRHALANIAANMYGLQTAGELLNHKAASSIQSYVKPGAPSYTITILYPDPSNVQMEISVSPKSFGTLTTAWEAKVVHSHAVLTSWGKGWEPGFFANYGIPGYGEPQGVWDIGYMPTGSLWSLNIYFPKWNFSFNGSIL